MSQFSGYNSNANAVHVRAQSPGDALDHWLAPNSAFNFTVGDEEDADIEAQLTATVGVTFEKTSGSSAKIANLGAPAAPSATAVHAAFAGNDAALEFPGPITDPDVPRQLLFTFAASYDGGDITVVGTGPNDEPLTEVITANPAGTAVSVAAFKTVTSLTKAAVGANAATVSVGTNTVLWAGIDLADGDAALLFVDGVGEAATFDATNDLVTPTTAPDGSAVFKVLAN